MMFRFIKLLLTWASIQKPKNICHWTLSRLASTVPCSSFFLQRLNCMWVCGRYRKKAHFIAEPEKTLQTLWELLSFYFLSSLSPGACWQPREHLSAPWKLGLAKERVRKLPWALRNFRWFLAPGMPGGVVSPGFARWLPNSYCLL